MGANGVAAIAEVQSNIPQLANSLTSAHGHIDSVDERLTGIMKALRAEYRVTSDTYTLLRLEPIENFGRSQATFIGRLRWLLTGR